jgi:diamine N-acetyltransferase
MVSIRPLHSDDFETIFRWENTEELWGVSEQKGPFSQSEIRDFMERCLDKQYEELERWIINFEETPVGAIDLFDFDRSSNSCGIGIFIADKANRRKGIASKALQLFLDTIQQRRIASIRAIIYDSNKASAALFQNNHFTFQAHLIYQGKPAMQYCWNLKS